MAHPLLLVSAALAAGIWAGMHLYLGPRWCLLLATLAGIAALAALVARRDRTAVAVALLGVFLTGNFFFLHEQTDRPRHGLESLVEDRRVDLSEPARLTGWVTRPPEPYEFSESFYLALEGVESLKHTYTASGTVRFDHYLHGREEPPLELRYGERLSILAHLRPIRGYHNPGGFDREARARREGVLYRGTVKAQELLERLPGRGGSLIGRALDRARAALLDRLDRLYPQPGPPDPTNALLRAMLLGERQGLDRSTREDFEKTGTFHALVIAGLHTAALGFLLLWALRAARVPPVPATLLAIGGLFFFAALAGMRVPVLRAAIMVSLYLVARLLFRERALLNTIAAAALFLLAWHPSELADAGFQLSFYSVLLIAALALPLIEMTSAPYRRALRDLGNKDPDFAGGVRSAAFRDRLRVLAERWPRLLSPARMEVAGRLALRIYDLLAVGVVLQVGFVLPMAVYFNRGGWVAVPANLLMVPLIGVVVPLGMGTLLLALLSPALAQLPAVPLAWSVRAMTEVAHWHAGFSIAARRVPPPPAWLGAAFVAALALVAVLVARRPRWAAMATVPALALAVVITAHPFPPQVPHQLLEVTALDVEQGDALLVVAPPGRTLLIDAGGLRDPDFGADTGAEVVAPYLWSRGIRRLDAVALTHAHEDHIGGLYAVLRNFSVGELWLGKNPDTGAVRLLKDLAAQRGIPVVEHRRGQSLSWGLARLEFLSPAADYQPGRRASNDDSLVIRLTYGRRNVLLPGDIERKMEQEMIAANEPLAADLLKVPHHGSKTSSTEEFLARVKAPYGIISVAAYSPFGHPNEEALERLRTAGFRVLETDRAGAITWATDGNRVFLRTFADERPACPTELW